MKYNRFPILSIAPLSLIAFVGAGCTDQNPNTVASLPAGNESNIQPITPAPTARGAPTASYVSTSTSRSAQTGLPADQQQRTSNSYSADRDATPRAASNDTNAANRSYDTSAANRSNAADRSSDTNATNRSYDTNATNRSSDTNASTSSTARYEQTGLAGADRSTATAAGGMEATAPRWQDLERHTYANRDQFIEGVNRLEEKVEEQVDEVKARREAITSVPSTADSKTWDASMKELNDSRSYLKSMSKEAANATEDTWRQKQEKVGQAWERTQKAYDKVNAGIRGRAHSGG